jgi:hypothetical protein
MSNYPRLKVWYETTQQPEGFYIQLKTEPAGIRIMPKGPFTTIEEAIIVAESDLRKMERRDEGR